MSDWLDFVKKHKNMRTAKGLLDLKAISRLWHAQKGYDPDLKSQKQKLNRLRAMREKYLEHATKEQYRDAIRDQKRITKSARGYDPASRKSKENIDTSYAESLGKAAHKRGLPSIPAQDKALWALTKGRKIGDKRTIPELKAWLKGWTKAHIDATDKELSYDPGWNKGRHNTLWNRVDKYSRSSSDDVKSHLRRTFDPSKPRRWFDAMVKSIKVRSDVRNPYAIVNNIWAKLTPTKKASIKAREAKGEPFKYDLPLPDDRATRGTGTLRMVRPFRLAEVQVNLSIKDYLAALKSGLFSKMKRSDGTTALVARCKSENKNCNIFVDKVT